MEGSNVPVRNLDLLRAIAVLLVAADHLLANGLGWLNRPDSTFLLAMGRLGVMIFFVHTSLVLMLSMQRMGVTGWPLVRSFYVRRIFRIYPLSVFTVLAVAIIGIPQIPFEAYHRMSVVQLLSNLALIQNITRAPDAIGPLWSLPWEVQMYVVLPFVFLALRAGKQRVVVMVGLAVLIIDAVGVGTGHRPFRMLDYVPCFMGGVLAFLLLRSSRPRIPSFLWPIVLLSLAAIYSASGYGWPVRKVYYPEWILCIVLGLLIPQFRDLRKGFLTAAAHQIAKYSYGIYLFHLPAVWLAFDRLQGIGIASSIGVFLVVTVGLSVAGYHLIEDPMIQVGKRLAARSELKIWRARNVPAPERT